MSCQTIATSMLEVDSCLTSDLPSSWLSLTFAELRYRDLSSSHVSCVTLATQAVGD